MATLNAARSFRNLFIAVLFIGSLTTACKKSDSGSDVDPRDQYVGTYEGGEKAFQSSLYINGSDFGISYGTAKIVITKGSNPKELYLDIQTSLSRPTPLKVTAELNGSTLTVIDRTKDQMNYGKLIEGDFKATGVFDTNQIVVTTTTEGLNQGTAVKRVETINGTRK